MSLVSVHMPSSMLGFNDGTVGNEPTVSGVTPPGVSAGGGAITMTVAGTGFTAGSKILIDGVEVPTTFVNATSLTTSWDPSTTAPAVFSVKSASGETSGGFNYTSTVTLRGAPEQQSAKTDDEKAPEPESKKTSGTDTAPTEVVPGDPGYFLPTSAAVPENIGALRELELEMDSLKKWKKGEHVTIGTGNVHWDGEDWAKGIA